MISKVAGQIRSSEIITTYGPGFIFNGKEGVSTMIMGLNFWPEAFEDPENLGKFKAVKHPFLESVCRKDHFRMPLLESGFDCVRGTFNL